MTGKRRMVAVLGALASAVVATAVDAGAARAEPGMRPPHPGNGTRPMRPAERVIPDDPGPYRAGPERDTPEIDIPGRSTFWL